MDASSIDESTSTESIMITPALIPVTNYPESLCRVGSGTSFILDYEGGVEAESRKLPSSRFKGVVPQPNRRWGAQIYEKHQRVWLGTFNEEEEAARSYDIAAQRFRGKNAVSNFKPLTETEEDDIEAAFLNSRSKAEIVDMLRKHTYKDELEQSKRSFGFNGSNGINKSCVLSSFGWDRAIKAIENLFEKTMTPSDVGKLNRLVIPKQHAEKHFPLRGGKSNSSGGVLLNFEDANGKVWRFRYSYWNSSQSYVLTKGWSRFVKESSLKAGDIISFQRSTGPNKQLYIDWKSRDGSGSGVAELANPVQMVRLFGVDIFKVPVAGLVNSNGSCSGKRIRDIELLTLECTKKQRPIDAL